MRNLNVYLWVFFAVKLLLVLIFALILFRPLRLGKKRLLLPRQSAHERFFCVKSTLKKMNEHFYVAQIVFTNKRDRTLTAQGETQRHISEEQN